MKQNGVVLLVILLVIFAAALYFVFNPPASGHSHGAITGPVPPDIRVQVDEVQRLAALADHEAITEADFGTLEDLLENNDAALDELNEVKVLIKYQEYEHASHALGFLALFLANGQKPKCPGHSLLHYYIYEKHGETELAQEQLEETETNLPAIKAYADVMQRIQQDIDAIHAGTTQASDAELAYLNNHGSVCAAT